VSARRADRGFTLLEVVIALAIVGALLVVAFGGLRVALASWTQGEDRAEAHQHLRGVGLILARSLGATYPYRAPLGLAPDPVLLFRGAETQVEFVTQAPPFPPAVPAAFVAVAIGVESGDAPALVIRQRLLPNRDPFSEAVVVLRDPSVQQIKLEYLNADGGWAETWDPLENEDTLPRAVRVAVSMARSGRVEIMPPVTIALRVGTK
jgi:general secretion pathway protein J